MNFIVVLSHLFFGSYFVICEDSCDKCVYTTPYQHYCYFPEYTKERCNVLDKLTDCRKGYIESRKPTSLEMIRNDNFQDFEITDGKETYVQIKPQHYKLVLEKGIPVNISFSFRPAKNYPLDLYYLMDLTYTMADDLQTLINLGKTLGDSMKSISNKCKIAFGSYGDKLLLPFSFTNAYNIDNPCHNTVQESCHKSYLFKHIQNFTDDLEEFTNKVRDESETSANIDDLESGVEALMQVIVCGKTLGWSNISRKFIILSTGSFMHLAGDGFLSGTVKRNLDECLVDENGLYLPTNQYDYPSLAQIHSKLKEHKINLILAVKDGVKDYYQEMSKVLEGSTYVGTLEENSTNIIKLTREGYEAITNKAKFSINRLAGLNVDFYADCDNEGYVKTDECHNVASGKEVKFIAEIVWKPEDAKFKDVLHIVERNIREELTIDVEYSGFCKCENYKNRNKTKCLNGGKFRCGTCECPPLRSGEFCEKECDDSMDACRQVVDGKKQISCTRNGDCKCSRCICDSPYTGEFCEYKCPESNDKKCSDNGICDDKGVCQCFGLFDGPACECDKSVDNCLFLGKTCNDHGTCECNKCTCHREYGGTKCEHSLSKETSICDEFSSIIKDYMSNGTSVFQHKNITVEIQPDMDIEGECYGNNKNETHYCTVEYKYETKSHIIIHVKVQCYKIFQAQVPVITGSIIFVIILVGMIVALMYKFYQNRIDKKEYETFIKNVQNSDGNNKNENPLYKSPITNHTVPDDTKKNC